MRPHDNLRILFAQDKMGPSDFYLRTNRNQSVVKTEGFQEMRYSSLMWLPAVALQCSPKARSDYCTFEGTTGIHSDVQ